MIQGTDHLSDFVIDSELVGGVLHTGFGGTLTGTPGFGRSRKRCRLVLALLLLGKEDGVDVGEDSALGDGDSLEHAVRSFDFIFISNINSL